MLATSSMYLCPYCDKLNNTLHACILCLYVVVLALVIFAKFVFLSPALSLSEYIYV